MADCFLRTFQDTTRRTVRLGLGGPPHPSANQECSVPSSHHYYLCRHCRGVTVKPASVSGRFPKTLEYCRTRGSIRNLAESKAENTMLPTKELSGSVDCNALSRLLPAARETALVEDRREKPMRRQSIRSAFCGRDRLRACAACAAGARKLCVQRRSDLERARRS